MYNEKTVKLFLHHLAMKAPPICRFAPNFVQTLTGTWNTISEGCSGRSFQLCMPPMKRVNSNQSDSKILKLKNLHLKMFTDEIDQIQNRTLLNKALQFYNGRGLNWQVGQKTVSPPPDRLEERLHLSCDYILGTFPGVVKHISYTIMK